MLTDDPESCYRAVKSRDRRFDGVFFTAVLSTGIYCRPSCPAITPQRRNVVFYRTAAAAQQAGFRACKRCRPDATPGSPEWDVAADTAGRAMRLIADGVVDREGVEGLASRVGYTPRHLSRVLTGELGAGPLALARARRAQTARILVESTTMPFAEVAFAAGFSSIRQFNDTVRAVYASTPSELRRRVEPEVTQSGVIELRLAVRPPFAAAELLAFLAARAVPGVEEAGSDWYSRTLRLPYGPGAVHLALGEPAGSGTVRCSLRLTDLRDLSAAVERCRRLLDADCDPQAVDAELGADDVLAPLVSSRPGLRVPGHVDGDELAVRAVLGQQVTVPHARRLAGLLAERYGDPGPGGEGRLFPSAETLASVPPEDLPMPRSRSRAIAALCEALAEGRIALDRSADRGDVRRALLDLPGIGAWTADYIAMRALGDPDVFLPTDVGVRKGLSRLGLDLRRADEPAEAWRPWRSYAQMHVWSLAGGTALNGVRGRAPRGERK
ncbi:MAG TPA: AlkA N-terminal domain-containing protein [Nocardioidaceae bacterium]|nr:AlkA N-terminal domain-containing protein [Nocardioidaceae bacterium]